MRAVEQTAAAANGRRTRLTDAVDLSELDCP